MKRFRTISRLLAGAAFLFALAAPWARASEHEQKIPLKDVPPEIVAAAKQEVPGIEFEDVSLMPREKYTIYEFDGAVGRQKYEIQVGVDLEGKIMGVKSRRERD